MTNKKIRVLGLVLIFGLSITCLKAQEMYATDSIYDSRIKSISYKQQNDSESSSNISSFPVLRLHKSSLTLEFDLLQTNHERLFYQIYYCNADWSFSDLFPEEYIDGFYNDQIKRYQYSSGTTFPYVHYNLTLPNSDTKFKLSGNYLIVVSNEQEDVLFTERMYVIENLVGPTIRFDHVSEIQLYDSHIELDICFPLTQKLISNPNTEVTLHVLQNMNVHTQITKTKPYQFVNDGFCYDQPSNIVFEAGDEYRFVDTRSIYSENSSLSYWEEKDKIFHAYTKIDLDRSDLNYHTRGDANGQFVFQSKDYDNESQIDYTFVHFALKANEPYPQKKVYITGGFCDWKLLEEHVMEYDASRKMYHAELLLKQGYYNYQYATVNTETQVVMYRELEKNWHEAENTYQVLLYYRPLGGRYDRIISFAEFNSNK